MRACRPVVELGPVQLGALEGRRVLRVGHDGRVPAHPLELLDPALGRRLAELGLGVRGEELERRRRRPLLAHEQHRRERAGQRQQRGAGELVVVERARSAGRRGRGCRSGRGSGWQTTSRQVGIASVSIGTPWSRPRNDEHVPSWKKPRSHTLASAAERLEVGVVAGRSRRSARRARRGGSRRSTARRARSRPPRAGVTSFGSLRSDSAIRVSGRPTVRGQRGDLDRQLLQQVQVGGVVESACTASSRSPSTW